MDYSFKMGLLGEMSHISFKHIYLVQVKKCTHLYILGIFIRRSDVAPGKYYGWATLKFWNIPFFFFKDFQQFFSLQVLFARSTRGLFLSFHSRPKILGVALTIITKTGIKHLVRTRHCPKALPTQSWAHVMPTQPCSAIIFFLHPLPTHSHTNTLLTLCSPDEITEGAPGWAIFLKETRLIRPCSGKKKKKKTVLKNCRRTDVFIQNWCSH